MPILPTPIIDSAEPEAVPVNTPALPDPGFIVLTLYGEGFTPDVGSPITNYWDQVRCLPRGHPAQENITGTIDYRRIQITAPNVPAAAVVDLQFHEAASGEWSEIIRAVFTVGSSLLPTGTSFTPSAGPAGTAITITGSNLFNTKALVFGESNQDQVSRQLAVVEINRVIAYVPEDFATLDAPLARRLFFLYPASETYPQGQVAIAGLATFTVLPPSLPPEVDTYSPRQGPIEGGTSVQIIGRNLDLTDRVDFGDTEAQRTFVGWDHLIVSAPAVAAPTSALIRLYHPLANVDVGYFDYIEGGVANPPRADAFAPTSGPTSGGTLLTITGTNLDQVTLVRIGNTEATDLDVTFGRITCRTGRVDTPGANLVWIVWPDGSQALPGLFTYQAAVVPPEEREPCTRKAWLVLGGDQLDLEDEQAGYVLAEFDVGWPAVREVVNNRPAAHGVDDRTRLFGARVITARILAGLGGTLTMDQVARNFGRYLLPDVRPELHWTLDTPDDEAQERTLVLRASTFSAPISGMETHELNFMWSAPDPVIRAAQASVAYARPATTLSAGRRYSLTFPRTYPQGASGAETGRIVSRGDVFVTPLVRLYGPVTGPSFIITNPGPPQLVMLFAFRSTFRIDAQRFVIVDCERNTVTSDDGYRLEGQVDWLRTQRWPFAFAGGQQATFTMSGVNTDHITQAIATWRDGWLTV